MSICLVMIVKDESHIIQETLENVIKHIPLHSFCISDTGSSDDTPGIIESTFARHSIPGHVFHDPWENFASNRNKVLEHARANSSADYLLMFDADDSVHGTFPDISLFASTANIDVFRLVYGSRFKFERPSLFRRTLDVKYISVIHEFLSTPANCRQMYLTGDYYIEACCKGNRSKNPFKFRDDALLLEKAFNEDTTGLKSRYAFYCAQSYYDAKMYDKSIEWYQRRLDLDGYIQEKYYSCWRLGHLYWSKNRHMDAIEVWIRAFQYDNERCECFVDALQALMKSGKNNLLCSIYNSFRHLKFKNNTSKLFIDSQKYHDNHKFYYSVGAFYTHEKKLAYQTAIELLDSNLHQQQQNLNIFNIKFYESFFSQETPETQQQIVCKIARRISIIYKERNPVTQDMAAVFNKYLSHISPKLLSEPLAQTLQAESDMLDVHCSIVCKDSITSLSTVLSHCSDIARAQHVTVFLSQSLSTHTDAIRYALPHSTINLIDSTNYDDLFVHSMRLAHTSNSKYLFYVPDNTLFFDRGSFIGNLYNLCAKDQHAIGQATINLPHLHQMEHATQYKEPTNKLDIHTTSLVTTDLFNESYRVSEEYETLFQDRSLGCVSLETISHVCN